MADKKTKSVWERLKSEREEREYLRKVRSAAEAENPTRAKDWTQAVEGFQDKTNNGANSQRPEVGSRGPGQPVAGTQVPTPRTASAWAGDTTRTGNGIRNEKEYNEDSTQITFEGEQAWLNNFSQQGQSVRSIHPDAVSFLKNKGYLEEGARGSDYGPGLSRWLDDNGFRSLTDKAKEELAKQMGISG